MTDKVKRRRHVWKPMSSYGWQRCECEAVRCLWSNRPFRAGAAHLRDGTPKSWCDRP